MNNNTTPHKAEEYDESIKNTIPLYEYFHTETIGLIHYYNDKCDKWLDIGCGTGTLVEKAHNRFPNTKFLLADFSEEMLIQAKNKLEDIIADRIEFLPKCSSQEINRYLNDKVDVITAIQVHHYLNKEERKMATKNCFDLLNEGGIYITFENIKPLTEKGTTIGLNRWGQFQEDMGKDKEAVEMHKSRFNKDYFPITIPEHLELLKETGFDTYEVFWYSEMQCGFYAIKAQSSRNI